MSQLYEYYITGDTSQSDVYGANWRGQTFTPLVAHKITSVKLKLVRVGSPGIVTVGIRATDGDGLPDGEDLCVGTTNGDTITTEYPGEWREITLGDGYDLDADTKYAIVARVLGGDAGNTVRWRAHVTTATYPRGNYVISGNSGVDWTGYTAHDFMFEDWGVPLYILHEWEGSDGLKLTDTLVKTPMKMVSDGVALSDVLVKSSIKVLEDGIALTDALVTVYLHVRSFIDGIAFTDTLVKSMARVLTDGIAFTDTLKKLWVHGVLRVLRAVRNLLSVREIGPRR